MKWAEVLAITLRRCKWRILLTLLMLILPLLISNAALGKPPFKRFVIKPLDDPPEEPPDPGIDPL